MSTFWYRIPDKLPLVYERVFVQFKLANAPIKHEFIAYLDDKGEWNLYSLYHSIPIDKSKVVPLWWTYLPDILDIPEE